MHQNNSFRPMWHLYHILQSYLHEVNVLHYIHILLYHTYIFLVLRLGNKNH